MPTPLPEGQEIVVTHIRIETQYHMDSMQMATDHYNIGITLQGHRRTITPTISYSYQSGDVALAPPYMFHRTLAEFDEPYERIMIKFSPKFVEPFIREVGQHIFDRLYETLVYHFTEEVAQFAGFSTGYFSHLFHTQLGMTYSAYLTNIQIRHVQLLLSTTTLTIMEIAQETGYCHGEYLSAQFKKKVGMTPKEYRKQCHLHKDTIFLADSVIRQL